MLKKIKEWREKLRTMVKNEWRKEEIEENGEIWMQEGSNKKYKNKWRMEEIVKNGENNEGVKEEIKQNDEK